MANGASFVMEALFGSARVRRTSWLLSTFGLVVFLVLAALIPLAQASPLPAQALSHKKAEVDTEDPELWVYLCTAASLVILGGAFAGLTIAYVFLLLHQFSENHPQCGKEDIWTFST
jgi:hypothetical protein